MNPATATRSQCVNTSELTATERYPRPSASTAFNPPNANEFDSAHSTCARRAKSFTPRDTG